MKMMWINYCTLPELNRGIFVKRWLERTEKKRRCIDDGDRFISLWIAFNGWMKGKFGENVSDYDLIDKVAELGEFESIFNDLKRDDRQFAESLTKLKQYSVVDMRYNNDPDREKRYVETFDSLIRVIYLIRCNLFHGRKDIDGDNKDFELVSLSYRILLPLFKKHLETCDHASY